MNQGSGTKVNPQSLYFHGYSTEKRSNSHLRIFTLRAVQINFIKFQLLFTCFKKIFCLRKWDFCIKYIWYMPKDGCPQEKHSCHRFICKMNYLLFSHTSFYLKDWQTIIIQTWVFDRYFVKKWWKWACYIQENNWQHL